jgi:tetratricopeptide (TPR) repeat protein
MHFSRAARAIEFHPPGAALALAAIVLAVLLSACARSPSRPVAPTAMPTPAAPVAAEQDLLLKLLVAQFALQDNDLARAAHGFADASALSADADLAEQATRLALSVKDWPLAQRALARWQQLAPTAPAVLQARAWIALGEKRGADAQADLETLALRADEDAWRLVAQTLLNAEDKAGAAKLLEALATPARLAGNETNWVAMSQLAFKLGDKAQARRLADAAVVRFHGVDAYAWSARLALDVGDDGAARASYAEALRREPGNLRLRSGYAALLADAGDNAGAARALAAGAQDDTTYAARAAYAARATDQAVLKALYREILADKSERGSRRHYLLGQIAEMIDRHQEALDWYRSVAAEDERWLDAQMREAVVLVELDRVDEAVRHLHRLAELATGDTEQLRNAYLLEADLLAGKQRSKDALAVYARALTSLPDDTRLLYARALFVVEQGDVLAGERDLRRVIELKPDDAEAMNALGYTLADNSRSGTDPKLKEALALIQRALVLKPEEPAIIDSMGWVRYRMGDFDGSLKELRRAHAKQPDPDIAAHLGEVLWVSGDRDEARRIWDAARKKAPDNKTLIEAIKRLTT